MFTGKPRFNPETYAKMVGLVNTSPTKADARQANEFSNKVQRALEDAVSSCIKKGYKSEIEVNNEMQMGLWEVIGDDFSKKFSGAKLFKDNISSQERMGFLSSELNEAKLKKGQLDKDIKKGLDPKTTRSQEEYQKIGEKQDHLKILESQIAFYENAIKICESAKNFAEKIESILNGENFNVEKNNELKLLANKATLQICASYALMLLAAAAYVAMIITFIPPALIGITASASLNTSLMAGAASCLFMTGSDVMKEYSNQTSNELTSKEINHSTIWNKKVIEFLNQLVSARPGNNVVKDNDMEKAVQEVRAEAKKVMEAAQAIKNIGKGQEIS